MTPLVASASAAPRSLFWAADGLYELPEMRFEFPFNLIGKSTMPFLTDQSWCVLKSWYTGGAQNKDFGAVWQTDRLNQSLVSSIAQITASKLDTTYSTDFQLSAVIPNRT